MSPLRDPIKTRTRFEGLLESAIKMYSNDIPNEINENNSTLDLNSRLKENRGKSAIPAR